MSMIDIFLSRWKVSFWNKDTAAATPTSMMLFVTLLPCRIDVYTYFQPFVKCFIHSYCLLYLLVLLYRFRQEYREERRLKAQEEAESISSSQLSTSNFGGGESGDTPQWDGLQNKNSTSDSDSNCNTTRSLNSDNSSVIQKSHRISRVVVFHKNTRETFIEGEMNDISLGTNSSPCTDSTDRCSHSNSSTTTRICPDKCKTTIDHFFDNDSFWSGQITWY